MDANDFLNGNRKKDGVSFFDKFLAISNGSIINQDSEHVILHGVYAQYLNKRAKGHVRYGEGRMHMLQYFIPILFQLIFQCFFLFSYI